MELVHRYAVPHVQGEVVHAAVRALQIYERGVLAGGDHAELFGGPRPRLSQHADIDLDSDDRVHDRRAADSDGLPVLSAFLRQRDHDRGREGIIFRSAPPLLKGVRPASVTLSLLFLLFEMRIPHNQGRSCATCLKRLQK